MKRILINSSGIAVSAPGNDVTTASSVSQFLFSTGLNLSLFGRPYLVGTISSVTATAPNTYTSPTFSISPIIHNLGYIPQLYLFPSIEPLTISGWRNNILATITTTEVSMQFDGDGSGGWSGTRTLYFDNGAFISYVIMSTSAI